MWRALPLAGADVRLHPAFLERTDTDRLFRALLDEVDWQREEIVVCGRRAAVPRLVAWQGEQGVHYRYSGTDHAPAPWTPAVLEIRARLAALGADFTFNGVLLNFYRGGSDSVGWHSDDERELGPRPLIASVSLGAERTLSFRARAGGGRLDVSLPHGSLLVMAGDTQRNWRHALPKRARAEPRVNLSYRSLPVSD